MSDWESIEPRRKAGRCADGFERGRGTVWHAVEASAVMGKALCGTQPGRRSVGWTEPLTSDVEVTCPRCRKRLEKQSAERED